VAELVQKTGVDVVKSLEGDVLQDDTQVYIGKKVKAVLQGGRSTLLVFPEPKDEAGEICWQTCTKQQLRSY